MEEHHQAYFAWRQAGVRQAWCWHVDAHLDLSRDGLDHWRDGQGPLGNAYVPWGGLHCGNYLYPAIQEGLVGRLTWVIPPWLVQGPLLSWARTHLEGWLDLRLEEWAGLREAEGVVRGTLLGIPFELGTDQTLPRPDGPVLLDLDLDYFVDEHGQLWGQELRSVDSPLTTVAYSVKGGYLPAGMRWLGERWQAWLEPVYQATALDEAAALVRRQCYGEAVEPLTRLLEKEPMCAGYLLGTCLHHLKQGQQALQLWQDLSGLPELSSDGRAYVLGLCCEALCGLGRPAEGLECIKAALRLGESDYRLFWAAAIALEQLQEARQATQMLRRALQLAEGYTISLPLRLGLARLYKQQGKSGLANLELERLQREDLTGKTRPFTLLRQGVAGLSSSGQEHLPAR